MLAKSWQKILIIILVIACLLNIFIKFSKIISFEDTIQSIKASVQKDNK